MAPRKEPSPTSSLPPEQPESIESIESLETFDSLESAESAEPFEPSEPPDDEGDDEDDEGDDEDDDNDDEDDEDDEDDDKPEVEIREMDINDVAKVYNLGEDIFTADRWPTLHRTWDEFEVLGLYLSDTDTCLVAEYEGEIVGFALGTLIDKRRSAWTYGYLLWLGVAPGLAGLGVGSKLVKRLTELFIQYDARMMLVDTEASNKPAIRFFEKVGFGHAREHVYLSMNLTSHPGYRRKRLEEKRAQEQRRRRRRAANGDLVQQPVIGAPDSKTTAPTHRAKLKRDPEAEPEVTSELGAEPGAQPEPKPKKKAKAKAKKKGKSKVKAKAKAKAKPAAKAKSKPKAKSKAKAKSKTKPAP
jgi:ribosomal protein S18 acetylase RimI-like enzyme